MAIYHFSGTVISRSQGRSAVACAAYRAAERLYDERYGKVHDYRKKEEVAYSEILAPDYAPAWMREREALWNAVERGEKRKDAQLAREFNFALPRELTLDENRTLSHEFVLEQFVKHGMVADLCIHNDKQADGEPHPHAHVMLTLRQVTPDGFGPKVRAWNDKALLLSWREAWAHTVNHHLSLNGHDKTIDHRTLLEQKIALEPQHKIGASVARDRLVRLEDHQRIARENGEKLLADPSIALHAITRQQSTFTHHDLARFVNRHTVDAEQFASVYEKAKQCDEMVPLGFDEKGRARFTTREMLLLEGQMIERALRLASLNSPSVSAISQEKALLNKVLSDEQKIALDHLLGAGGLKCVVGYAGTGKSHLLGAARLAWESEGLMVSGVTLSGIAAQNLQGGSGIVSRTLASRCHYWDKGEQRLSSRDVLVVDEAGMLSSRQMARLMEEAHRVGAKVVLVGDPQQLQAIEAGAAFRAIAEHTRTVELTDVRRQQVAWQQMATKELAQGETAKALERYLKHSHVHAFETQAFAKMALVEHWNDARLADASKTQLMLAYERRDVLQLNELARDLRLAQGELGREESFKTERGERVFAEGERVYFLKNDRSLGVMNGTLGTIQKIEGTLMTVALDNVNKMTKAPAATRCIRLTMEHYNQLDYGYAATIHKAQGVTVDRSYVLASKYLDSHSSYVALSRHRDSVDLFYGRDVFLSEDALTQVLGRERAKEMTLDYSTDEGLKKAFARGRGVTEEAGWMAPKQGQPFELAVRSFDQGRVLMPTQAQTQVQTPTQGLSEADQLLQAKVLKRVEEYERLKGLVEQGGRSSSMASDYLNRHLYRMAQEKEVMVHVREHHQAIAKEVEARLNVLQRQRGLGRGRGL